MVSSLRAYWICQTTRGSEREVCEPRLHEHSPSSSDLNDHGQRPCGPCDDIASPPGLVE